MSKETALAEALDALTAQRTALINDIKVRAEKVDALTHQIEALSGSPQAETGTPKPAA